MLGKKVLTGGGTDQLQPSSQCGFDHLTGIYAPFRFTELKERV
jgi:hypothetical protein